VAPRVLSSQETQPGARRGQWPPTRRLPLLAAALMLVLGLVLLSLLVGRSNVLILGTDRPLPGTDAARTDTIILATFQPGARYVGLLSIPRDLWLPLPDGRVNRINTAYYFAELEAPGSGPSAAEQAVASNFGVRVDGSVVLHFEGLMEVVDGLGGVEIVLEAPRSGYPAGRHLLTGEQALAFVRDRRGTDDFFRMANGQLLLRALLGRLTSPAAWPGLPRALGAALRSVETDLPPWRWPGVIGALVLVAPRGIDSRVIDRSMAEGMIVGNGAQVLRPRWDVINPTLLEMFGE
jgi:LCP family protein required for cell wall assembly